VQQEKRVQRQGDGHHQLGGLDRRRQSELDSDEGFLVVPKEASEAGHDIIN
jgi:hypothetical protein